MGPRWMIGDEVIDILAAPDGSAYILTANSLTHLFTRKMTLREKAKHYDAIVQARHVRHGAVTSCNLRDVERLRFMVHDGQRQRRPVDVDLPWRKVFRIRRDEGSRSQADRKAALRFPAPTGDDQRHSGFRVAQHPAEQGHAGRT